MASKPVNQQQLINRLEEMLKLPENKECADCGTKAPRWASTNLGIFICIRCSGIHRSMGTHISKVKSVSLDKWTPEQVEFMSTMGNGKSNAIHEADVANYNRGDIRSDNIALEQWIRDKYERKRFTRRADSYSRPQEDSRYDNRSHERQSHDRPSHERQSHDRPHERQERIERLPVDRHANNGSYSNGNGNGTHHVPVVAPPTRNPPPVKAPPPVTAPAPVAPAPVVDLLDWDAPKPAPPANNASSNSFDTDFGGFVSANGNSAPTPAPPTVDKNSILSLFNTPGPGYGPPGGYPPHGYPPHMGGYPPQMGGYPGGMPGAYPPHMGGYPGGMPGGMHGGMGGMPGGMHGGMPGGGMHGGMGGMPGNMGGFQQGGFQQGQQGGFQQGGFQQGGYQQGGFQGPTVSPSGLGGYGAPGGAGIGGGFGGATGSPAGLGGGYSAGGNVSAGGAGGLNNLLGPFGGAPNNGASANAGAFAGLGSFPAAGANKGGFQGGFGGPANSPTLI